MAVMIGNLDNIFVFKTNIKRLRDKKRVMELLESHNGIDTSNVDQQDVDCVLRVVSDHISAEEIISLVNRAGFECAELE